MSTEIQIERRYTAATLAVLDMFQAAVDALANDFNLDNAATAHKLARRINDALGGPDAPVGEADGRTAKWRCRFRIYDTRNLDDVVADSDDGLPPDHPGATVLSGLPNVAAEARELAKIFHEGKTLVGMSREELDRRLKSVRPTLSRRGGDAAWRVPYETMVDHGGIVNRRSWLMRVDILREETEK